MVKDKLYQLGIKTYKTLSRYHTFNVRQVKVETTKVCNLLCPGCRRNYSASISTEPGPQHLSTGQLWRILATTSMMLVRFEGDGEPTCNPHFRALVQMCSDAGVASAMTCNATLLNKDYIQFLQNHGMKRIHVSFDGTDKDTFEKARRGADYEKVLHNCELIGKSGIQLFMNVLLSSDAIIDQLPKYAELAKRVDATGVHFMKYQAENLFGHQAPNLTKHRGTFKAFENKAKKLGLMFVSTITEESSFSECEDAFTCPYVLLNNDVYACSYMANLRRTEVFDEKVLNVPYKNYLMGNLEDHWMKDIWYNEAYSDLRRFLNDSHLPKGTGIEPHALLKMRTEGERNWGRFAYCASCLCRWGESGI